MAKPVIEITLLGDKELTRIFSTKNVGASLNALKKALYEEAWVIMNESQRRVPVDFGTLRRSRAVLQPKVSGTIIEIEMGYGGAASGYAMEQHENPNYRHKNGRTWKYLEAPVREYMPVLELSLTRRLEFYLRSK